MGRAIDRSSMQPDRDFFATISSSSFMTRTWAMITGPGWIFVNRPTLKSAPKQVPEVSGTVNRPPSLIAFCVGGAWIKVTCMQLKRTDDYENSILVVIILHTGRDTTNCNLSITQMQAGQRDAGQSPSGYEVGPGSYRVTYRKPSGKALVIHA